MKILGWGENFRLGRKFWVGAKILGSGENFKGIHGQIPKESSFGVGDCES